MTQRPTPVLGVCRSDRGSLLLLPAGRQKRESEPRLQHTQSDNYVAEPREGLVAAQGHPTVQLSSRSRGPTGWGEDPSPFEGGMGLPWELPTRLVEAPETTDQRRRLWNNTDPGSNRTQPKLATWGMPRKCAPTSPFTLSSLRVCVGGEGLTGGIVVFVETMLATYHQVLTLCRELF